MKFFCELCGCRDAERPVCLFQGIQKCTFQLEVYSKTEDVVQTLLQVTETLMVPSRTGAPSESDGASLCLHTLMNVLQLHRASCLDKLGDQAAMVSQQPARKVQTPVIYSDVHKKKKKIQTI